MPEEEITPVKRPRAPRKRAASSDTPAPRAPRRTVARKPSTTRRTPKVQTDSESTEAAPVAAVARARKAPTPIATEQSEKKTRKRQLMIAGAVLLFGIGASAAVGFSDAGKIDVNKTIEARNERITSSGDENSGEVIVPVQNTSGQPNGGMRGRGVGTKNITPPTDETASTTEAIASTTEAVPPAEELVEAAEVATETPE